MTTYLGKSCSFGLPRVPFINCRQFMYLVNSLLVLRAGCGIWLYQFLIIAYLCALCFFYGAFHVFVLPCSLFSFFFCFFFFPVLFNIVITSVCEGRSGICAFLAFVCLFCARKFLPIFTVSQGLAAVCACDTPWTLLISLFKASRLFIIVFTCEKL